MNPSASIVLAKSGLPLGALGSFAAQQGSIKPCFELTLMQMFLSKRCTVTLQPNGGDAASDLTGLPHIAYN